jgi:hypothetical protein
MARSSVAAAISFWLTRGGVSGLSTLKSALMRSRACLPSSCARSPARRLPQPLRRGATAPFDTPPPAWPRAREPGLTARRRRPRQGCLALQPGAERSLGRA